MRAAVLETKNRHVGSMAGFSDNNAILENRVMAEANLQPDIISRQQAKSAGLNHYFTGKPCKHGHVAKRSAVDCKCVICTYEYTKAYHASHRAMKRESDRKWAKRNPQKVKANQQRWRAANREWRNIRECLLGKKHPERTKARRKRWAEKHPEKARIIAVRSSQIRRTRKQGTEGHFSVDDIVRIRKMQRNKCAICKTKLLDLPKFTHVDHIIPLSGGGSSWPNNLQLLCGECNSAKWAHDPIDFMRSRGFLL